MDVELKALLRYKMQEFLDDNADSLGSIHGIWQDTTNAKRNATLMAEAASVVVDAAQLQNDLDSELNG